MKSYRESIKNIIEKSFSYNLKETPNTVGADVNEIMFGYLMANTWDEKVFVGGTEAKKQVAERKKLLDPNEFKDQVERAKEMVEKVKEWASQNGYDGEVVKVWWTARPGVLSKAVGKPVDSRKNPTDILLQFKDQQFLGVSAKSTKGSSEIGFKNPGMGTLAKALNIDFISSISGLIDKTIKKLKLPATNIERKKFIRDNPEIQKQTTQVGSKVLNILRDILIEKLDTLNQKERKAHILSQWLDADDKLYPYYVKATGLGKKGKYSARVFDPIKNDKMKYISSEDITFVPVGNESIGVMAGGHKILKIRFKYSSEKLASNIKLSGDPW